MADAVQNVEIKASLSPDYEKAFNAAQKAVDKTTSALTRVVKEEAELQKVSEARARVESLSNSKDLKAKANAQKAYDKLLEKMKLTGKSTKDLDKRLAELGNRRKELEKLTETMRGRADSLGQKSLAASIQEANKAIEKTGSLMDRLKSKGANAFKAVGKGLANIGKGALMSIGHRAMGAISEAFSGLVQDAGNFKAQAPLTGMTESDYSGLVRSLKYNNIGESEIAQMFNTAASISAGAQSGDKSQIDVLRRLGLGRNALNGLSQKEQVETLINALVTNTSGDEMVKLSRQILGRNGAALVTQLKDTGMTGTTMFEAAKAKNLDEKALEDLHAASDKTIEIQETIQKVMLEIIKNIDMKLISDVMKGMTEFITKVVPVMSKVFTWVNERLIQPLMDLIRKALAYLGEKVGGVFLDPGAGASVVGSVAKASAMYNSSSVNTTVNYTSPSTYVTQVSPTLGTTREQNSMSLKQSVKQAIGGVS